MSWKVVIVEDEDLLRQGLTTCFEWEELGFEVVGDTDNGRKALEMIEQKKPDVVFTDIKMPVMDGIAMTEKLKKEYPRIRVVIISGYDEFEYARRALKAGVSEYILKPIQLDNLKTVLERLCKELQEESENEQELLRLKDIREHGMVSIRHELFSKVLLQNQPIESLEGVIELLDAEVKEQYYCTGIVSSRDFPMMAIDCDYLEIMELDTEFGKKIQGYIENIASVDALRESYCERLLCIYGTDQGACKDRIKDIEDRIRMEEKEDITYVFGPICQGVEGVYTSYMHAKKAGERNYLQTWNAVLKTEVSVDTKIKYMNYDGESLFYEIRSGTPESVERELQKFEEEMEKEKIYSHMHIVLIISNLYFELTKLPEEVGGSINEILGEPMEHYHRLLAGAKRKEMFKYLRKICKMLNEYFSSVQGGKTQGVIKRVTDYIKEYYANEELSMKEVAKQAYISVSYLGIVLKKETGKTFIEYLTDFRMEQAKKFLIETDMRSYEVAEKCGYSNPTYFSTVFKGAVGMSPSAYRKQNKPAT